MIRVVEFFWPRLSRPTTLQLEDQASNQTHDLQLIKDAKWDTHTEMALECARALHEQETERKRSSESKASIYLAVIAAIFPVLVSLPKDLYGEEFPDMSAGWQTVLLGFFVLGVVYLVRSGIWAFRTLAVSTHNRIDATDIVHLWGEPDANRALIRDLLITTRMNRAGVNAKVAYIKMAHAFLLRTFIAFAILLLIAVLRKPFVIFLDATIPMVQAAVCGS